MVKGMILRRYKFLKKSGWMLLLFIIIISILQSLNVGMGSRCISVVCCNLWIICSGKVWIKVIFLFLIYVVMGMCWCMGGRKWRGSGCLWFGCEVICCCLVFLVVLWFCEGVQLFLLFEFMNYEVFYFNLYNGY